MNKIWLVFKYEYTRHVMRRRFLIALLSMPLFIGFMMGVSIIASLSSVNRSPVGYIDKAGLLANAPFAEPKKGMFNFDVKFIAYPNEDAARSDLNSRVIQAYFIIPADYLDTSKIQEVYLTSPSNDVTDQLRNQIRGVLLASQPADVVNRIQNGSHVTIVSADGTRRTGENDWFNLVLQFASGLLFIIVVFTSSGYLLNALVEEKENRTMEIVITSVSPEQLMAGKVLGNLSVGLTQLAVWGVCIAVGILVGQNFIPALRAIQISGPTILVFLATMLPAFVMVAALMAMLGSTVSEAREASQWTGLITLPVVAPYWFSGTLIANPASPLAVGLSLFPLTAPVTISMRMAVGILPAWQVIASSAILILCAAGSIWLAARAFRIGMVRYGKKVAFKELFAKVEK